MARDEADLGAWKRRMPEPLMPAINWQGGRILKLSAAGILFLGACFWIPQRCVVPQTHHAMEIGEEIGDLAHKVEILKQEEFLEPLQAEELKKDIKEIEPRATGEDPVATWQSMSYLEEVIHQTAHRAAEEAHQETEELAQAETLAQVILQDDPAMQEVLTQAMAELSGMVEKEATKRKKLKKHLSDNALKACRNGTLDKKGMEEILNGLRRRKDEIKESLKRLEVEKK